MKIEDFIINDTHPNKLTLEKNTNQLSYQIILVTLFIIIYAVIWDSDNLKKIIMEDQFDLFNFLFMFLPGLIILAPLVLRILKRDVIIFNAKTGTISRNNKVISKFEDIITINILIIFDDYKENLGIKYYNVAISKAKQRITIADKLSKSSAEAVAGKLKHFLNKEIKEAVG